MFHVLYELAIYQAFMKEYSNVFKCQCFLLQMIMKEQDKVLMKQFVNLRSQIVQLRSIYDVTSSNSDISQDGSTISIDDVPSEPNSPQPRCNESELGPDLDLTEFGGRTTSMLSPSRRNGAVTRIKWKSNEYI